MSGFQRLFVANRGEVAVRILRTCDRMGVTPVLGVSAADEGEPYTRGRECVRLGPARADESYLDMERVVQAARQSGCTALHPGWGFLSENPAFAALCEQHGVSFVGPPAHIMQQLGRKTPAKRAMAAAGLAVIPGSDGPLSGVEEAAAEAERVGYPVMLKAESGGGGKGMRRVEEADGLERAYGDASREALRAFGDGRLYLEKLLDAGRHVEIQILADRHGSAVHVGERDCSVQRQHQKLVEESPAPLLADEAREETLARAVDAVRAIGYVGAGTLEFLVDPDDGALRFMEMNARLQVEHSVSEMRSGLDLVEQQLRVAAGERLGVKQEDVVLEGHAIECRINAENPEKRFFPSPGTVSRFDLPRERPGRLRIDTHIEEGSVVSPHYDSLIAKVIARGDTRDEACDGMLAALSEMRIEGIRTTIPLHLAVLDSEEFREHRYDTRAIPGWPPADAAKKR